MAMGFAVVPAAEVAAGGGSLDDVVRAAEKRCAASSAFFYVDTLEYLRRGGRIGPAAALLGSALSVKPLLHLVDGRIAPLEKVRTSSARWRGWRRSRSSGPGPRRSTWPCTTSPRRRAPTSSPSALRTRVPGLRELVVSEVGAVVGAHVGPGMLAVAVSPV